MKYHSFLHYDVLSAFNNFKKKWIHSLLSVMGIMIFIISIIVMISISNGAKQKTLENIRDLGINTIRIINKPFSNASSMNKNRFEGLSHKNYQLIERIVNKYGYTSMVIHDKNQSIFLKKGDTTASVIGSNEVFLLIENLEIIKGRPLLQNDVEHNRFNAVVSEDIAFKYNIGINENIVFNGTTYKVVGISTIKNNLNNFIFVPYSTLKFSNQIYDQINIFIKNQQNIPLLANILKNKISAENFNINNFTVSIPLEILAQEKEAQKTFNIILISIAILSLLTGGISVMNAVLSNINEQTREIGLKMALGATKKRIIRYYLLYTSFLAFVGGIVGGVVGYIILILLYIFSDLYIVFSLEPFLIGIVITLLSGIIFGIYPAMRASNIQPIIALKEF